MTTVPLSVCYGALNLLVLADTFNFVPCLCPSDCGGVRGSGSTVPSSAISVGSMAAERSYRARRILVPSSLVDSPTLGPNSCFIPFDLLSSRFPCLYAPCIVPSSMFSSPKRRSQQGVVVSRVCTTLTLLSQTWPFIGPTRLEQAFHWLMSVSRDFLSPIDLLLLITNYTSR